MNVTLFIPADLGHRAKIRTAVAQADQLVPDLPAAFDLLYATYGTNYPSFATFITGPSRTGDIERILVLGAHGPRNLTVIVIR